MEATSKNDDDAPQGGAEKARQDYVTAPPCLTTAQQRTCHPPPIILRRSPSPVRQARGRIHPATREARRHGRCLSGALKSVLPAASTLGVCYIGLLWLRLPVTAQARARSSPCVLHRKLSQQQHRGAGGGRASPRDRGRPPFSVPAGPGRRLHQRRHPVGLPPRPRQAEEGPGGQPAQARGDPTRPLVPRSGSALPCTPHPPTPPPPPQGLPGGRPRAFRAPRPRHGDAHRREARSPAAPGKRPGPRRALRQRDGPPRRGRGRRGAGAPPSLTPRRAAPPCVRQPSLQATPAPQAPPPISTAPSPHARAPHT